MHPFLIEMSMAFFSNWSSICIVFLCLLQYTANVCELREVSLDFKSFHLALQNMLIQLRLLDNREELLLALVLSTIYIYADLTRKQI